jgi:hypothetical protein
MQYPPLTGLVGGEDEEAGEDPETAHHTARAPRVRGRHRALVERRNILLTPSVLRSAPSPAERERSWVNCT